MFRENIAMAKNSKVGSTGKESVCTHETEWPRFTEIRRAECRSDGKAQCTTSTGQEDVK